ncbi:uncharacterized protein LOC141856099 isoform X2 [Brevipalpus obovatus]|uniref:uncharacterized protein LOC141856099 isoform X2 n=1 Tax=Brevipalpus obovatus TaxID=246614 RepID=UPI003D9F3FD0
MMDFEFESDEEEQLEKAVQEILEKRRQKIGRGMQTTTHDDHQITISHEPNSYDEESRSVDNAKNDNMVTGNLDDGSTDNQIEENGDLIDTMDDEEEMASKPNDSTDEYDLTPEFSDLTDREEIRSELDDSSIGEGGISIPRISPSKHKVRGKKRQGTSNMKKFEVIMNGEDGKKAHRKLTLMDYHGKHKLNLTDENIHVHSSGYGYQIYHGGQVIDGYSLRQFLETKVLTTKSGKLLCKVHSDCYFRKPKSQKSTRLLHNLLEHIQASFITYLCRFCFHTFCYRMSIQRHLNFHKRCQRGFQNSWNQPTKYGSSIVTRKFTKNRSDMTLMNSKMKCELNITDKYINQHPKTGHEYQIYYEGQAIDRKDMKRVIKKNTIKDAESGKLLCGVHQDCLYSDPEKPVKKPYAKYLYEHIRKALMIYLCRSCFKALGSFSSLVCHFKIHAKNCIK